LPKNKSIFLGDSDIDADEEPVQQHPHQLAADGGGMVLEVNIRDAIVASCKENHASIATADSYSNLPELKYV
jgi:hypothetical protein